MTTTINDPGPAAGPPRRAGVPTLPEGFARPPDVTGCLVPIDERPDATGTAPTADVPGGAASSRP